jgi:hypothetical protein
MRMTCFKKFFPNPEDLAKVKEEYARFSSFQKNLMILTQSMIDGLFPP